uniref:Peptidase A2 domain-containing protein n=1 Tax=Strongyloides stercoralis TaxID=6248 RepID=A0A0K0EBC9_STRER
MSLDKQKIDTLLTICQTLNLVVTREQLDPYKEIANRSHTYQVRRIEEIFSPSSNNSSLSSLSEVESSRSTTDDYHDDLPSLFDNSLDDTNTPAPAMTTFGFTLSVSKFNHYEISRTFTLFRQELENAFILDGVLLDHIKIGILRSRMESHSLLLLPAKGIDESYLEYANRCSLIFPEGLSTQSCMNRYLRFSIDKNDLEKSLRKFIQIAEVALKDVLQEQRTDSIKAKLMELLQHDYDLWNHIRESKAPLHTLIEDVITREQQNQLRRRNQSKRSTRTRWQDGTQNKSFTQNLKCSHCQYPGHVEANCQKKERGLPKGDYPRMKRERFTEQAKTSYKSDNINNAERKDRTIQPPHLIICDIQINNAKARALIDNGANISLMGPTLAKQLEITGNKSMTILKAGNIAVVQEILVPITLKVQDLSITEKENFAINDTDFTGFDLLLSSPTLKKLGAVIDTRNSTVNFNPREHSLANVNFVLSSQDIDQKEEKLFQEEIAETFPNLTPTNEYDAGQGFIVAEKQEFFIPEIQTKFPFFKTAPSKEEDDIVAQLLQNNIISPMPTIYEFSPHYLITKRNNDGTVQTYVNDQGETRIRKRLVLDCRHVNSRTVKKQYSAPTLGSIIGQLTSYQYASKIDLSHGFYQVILDSETKKKFAFIRSLHMKWVFSTLNFKCA